ncbi:MAG: hypothetical protein GY778_19115, partial [bacterium]|nr:hypothetical protein [bacterium]
MSFAPATDGLPKTWRTRLVPLPRALQVAGLVAVAGLALFATVRFAPSASALFERKIDGVLEHRPNGEGFAVTFVTHFGVAGFVALIVMVAVPLRALCGRAVANRTREQVVPAVYGALLLLAWWGTGDYGYQLAPSISA